MANGQNKQQTSPRVLPTVVPAAASLIVLKDDDTFTAKYDDKGNSVITSFTVRPKEGGPRYVVNTTFDLTGVKPEEIRAAAMRTWIIERQRAFRVMFNGSKRADALKPATWSVAKVRDMLDAERTRNIDPVANAKRAMSKLTPAERAAIIAELSK